MKEDLRSILLTEQQICGKLDELASQIAHDYKGKNLMLVGVLKGSFIFMADLIRRLDMPCQIDFMVVSSYGNKSETTGAVRITKDLSSDIEGLDVLIIEDILDSGLTLSYLMNYLHGRNPASIKVCTLLDKPGRRKVQFEANYCGFKVPDEFVVGYGLDYAEKYRNLPYIGVLKPEIYM